MKAAILDFRPAAVPGPAVPNKAAKHLVRLFVLDRLPAPQIPTGPHRLVCHWRRGADGQLGASWEPDIPSVPHR